MHGNVWEWVEDCWNESYEGAPDDGSAWISGDCARRVVRGGSWNDPPRNLRSASRTGIGPEIRYYMLAFGSAGRSRAARALPPPLVGRRPQPAS